MLNLRLYGAVNAPAIDSAVDLSAGSRTKVELTKLISRLMESEDPEALKREYGSELVEDAISVLENRIRNEFILFWSSCVSADGSDGRNTVTRDIARSAALFGGACNPRF